MSTKIEKQPSVNGPTKYNYEHERNSGAIKFNTNCKIYSSLYHAADKSEEDRIFNLFCKTPGAELQQLEEEIKIRIGITAQEIFMIGQLLTRAKKVCQQEKIGFKNWISETFDFSYETANNFRNVYKYCFAHRAVAILVPISILYKLAKPSFADELREFLFTSADLKQLSNGKLRILIKKYEQGGIKAVQEETQELSRASMIDHQIKCVNDQFQNAFRAIEKFLINMDEQSKGIGFDVPQKVEHHEPEAKQIQTILYEALTQAREVMQEAQKEADKIHADYLETHLNLTDTEEEHQLKEAV